MLKLGLVGMEHAVDLIPSELSVGMRKRAGLARALALDPSTSFSSMSRPRGSTRITSSRLDDLVSSTYAMVSEPP